MTVPKELVENAMLKKISYNTTHIRHHSRLKIHKKDTDSLVRKCCISGRNILFKKSLYNKTEGQRLNFYKTKTLPAIDDSVNVKHGYNLEDESLPQMTCSVEVAH